MPWLPGVRPVPSVVSEVAVVDGMALVSTMASSSSPARYGARKRSRCSNSWPRPSTITST